MNNGDIVATHVHYNAHLANLFIKYLSAKQHSYLLGKFGVYSDKHVKFEGSKDERKIQSRNTNITNKLGYVHKFQLKACGWRYMVIICIVWLYMLLLTIKSRGLHA